MNQTSTQKENKHTPGLRPYEPDLRKRRLAKQKEHNYEKSLEAVNSIATMKLTEAGRLLLVTYHAFALLQAENGLKSLKGKCAVGDPFAYFVGICNKRTKENDLERSGSAYLEAIKNGTIKRGDPKILNDGLDDKHSDGYERYHQKLPDSESNNRPSVGPLAIYKSSPKPTLEELEEKLRGFNSALNASNPHQGLFSDEVYFGRIHASINELNLEINKLKGAICH